MVNVDPPQENADGLVEHQVIEVEVEVDMDRRRIAFGSQGGQLMEAPVKLSGSVRPWAYLWEEGDAIMLASRPVPNRPHMTRHRKFRTAANTAAPSPLRSRAVPTLAKMPSVKTPSHAETGDYLPTYTYDSVSWQATTPSSTSSGIRPRSPAAAIRSGISSARSAIYSPEGKRIRRKASPTSPEASGAAAGSRTVASGGQIVASGWNAGTPQQPLSGAFSERPRRIMAPRRFRSPSRSPPRDSSAITLRSPSGSPLSPRSPRENKGTHMWDMVRYVSGVYSDVYRQI